MMKHQKLLQLGVMLVSMLIKKNLNLLLSLLFLIVKASLISNDSVQAGEDYLFPRENDDLSNFTGGNTQFTFPNDALKGVLKQLPNCKCVLYNHIMYREVCIVILRMSHIC